MKLYAKQVPPEQQECPLDLSAEELEGLVLDGNSRLKSHTTPAYDHVVKNLEEMCEVWREHQVLWTYQKGRPVKLFRLSSDYTAADALRDFQFTKELAGGTGDWTEEEYAAWKELLMVDRISKEDARLKAMSLITGHTWESRTISGCCQSEWQTAYYDTELWGPDSLNVFETMYFNEGSEWVIHDGDAEPKGSDDIEGHSLYCVEFSDDALKKEIAAHEGVKPEDVVLFKFDGYIKIPQYEIA